MAVDVHTLSPNARALYWYLVARGPSRSVPEIVAESGIPLSSLYKVAQRHPDVFSLTGTLLRLSTRQALRSTSPD